VRKNKKEDYFMAMIANYSSNLLMQPIAACYISTNFKFYLLTKIFP